MTGSGHTGFAGLGRMGLPMTTRLLAAGYTVTSVVVGYSAIYLATAMVRRVQVRR